MEHKLTNVHSFKTLQICSFHKKLFEPIEKQDSYLDFEGVGLFIRETKFEASQRTLRQATLMDKGGIKK